MKSKTEVERVEGDKRTYPWWGISNDGKIVEFFAERKGVVVVEGDSKDYKRGYCSSDWFMECFTQFRGKITITVE